jgi:hypothetical protein
VIVTARDAACAPNNRLNSLHFTRTDNATVDVGSIVGATGDFTVSVPSGGQATFFVNRASAGAAATVQFVANDGCGNWPSFVGGGPSAF